MATRKPKKPKKPKQTAALSTWLRYEQRMKDYDQKLKDIETAKKKKAEIIKRAQKLK